MGREGRIWSTLLICLTATLGCIKDDNPCKEADIYIQISGAGYPTRAYDPDENLVKDINLLIFDVNGIPVDNIWLTGITPDSKGRVTVKSRLLLDKEYHFYACANLGHRLEALSLEEIEDLRFHLVYPDDYREGMPMAGKMESVMLTGKKDTVVLALERLMAKISLRIDRGGLSEGVRMNVTSVSIGNCPKSSSIFHANRIENEDQCFSLGFTRNELECSVLNRNADMGKSGTISLYMLENMQGRFSTGDIRHDSDKVIPENDMRRQLCSYIEIRMDYQSPELISKESPLIYRFYLGGSRNDLDIERNCHYSITVIPEDDGLSDDSWRVDKSGLCEMTGNTYFSMEPSGYIQGDIGDMIHVRCNVYPPETPFEIGMEELEYDRSRGIYDYQIDEDGLGVTLTLKAPGTGILYMSAGSPVNESGMLVVEVNNIKNNIP